ncbi:30S ribosomal protein THX [Kushneria phosphatilytica]|uniref:30S ribosomal protein THX n=1 Tax=Kushneria phosphatilytica TaxID=657387 RepID=A0A1S1NY72_9GAMM|nr:30S ribosomal protein THX [Kushneria phosphatilytica]OHV12837.1 ribosomal small subunit protein bTHX [Kushneria phosphatilytica]QEL10686.1 30S ribosomal protein THX [Kushneria phosphatilytica]
MAKGDRRSKRGKIWLGTFGRRRPKTLRQKRRRLQRVA